MTGTTSDFIAQSGKVGYLQTNFYANDGAPVIANQTASLTLTSTSTVAAQYHYTDRNGNDHTIALPDLTQTLTDNKDTLTVPTLTDDDQALIPDGYHVVTDSTSAPVVTVVNSTHGDYGTNEPNGTATVGDVSQYYFDGDTLQFELAENQYTANVTYVDDDAAEAVVGQDETTADFAGETGTYQVDATKYPTTYDLATNQATSVAYTLTADDSDAITIHLVHKHTVADSKTTNYTVNYVGLPADKAVATASGTVDWTADQDEVTQVITYTPSKTTVTVNVPTVAGYTADAGNQVFAFDTTTTAPTDQSRTVTYTPTAQDLAVTYVMMLLSNH